MLAATHDLADTLDFARVVVLDGGRIVEQGPPAQLAADSGSRYARLLAAERELAAEGWSAASWTRWRVEEGRLAVTRPDEHAGGPG